jgi:rhodanese-related sulfurtransferase
MDNWIWWALGAVVLYLVLKPRVPAGAALSPAELKELIAKDKDLQLIDVRSAGECAGGRIAGARNIPVGDIVSRSGELNKNKALVVYCHSGQRSAMALQRLVKAGYAQTKHLNGGISAWKGAGLPVKG